MVDGWNPYGPAAAGNAAMQQRQQMMAQKLIVPAVQAPPPQYSMPVSSGPDAPPPANPLAGMDMISIARLLKQANPEAKAGLFGGGQDGYQAGFMGSGIGKQNSEGADTLQQFGLYNPLPQS